MAFLAGSKRFIKYFPGTSQKGFLCSGALGSASVIASGLKNSGDDSDYNRRIYTIVGLALAAIAAPTLAKTLLGQADLNFRTSLRVTFVQGLIFGAVDFASSFMETNATSPHIPEPRKHAHIDTIPETNLTSIFQYLDQADILNVTITCKSWSKVIRFNASVNQNIKRPASSPVEPPLSNVSGDPMIQPMPVVNPPESLPLSFLQIKNKAMTLCEMYYVNCDIHMISLTCTNLLTQQVILFGKLKDIDTNKLTIFFFTENGEQGSGIYLITFWKKKLLNLNPIATFHPWFLMHLEKIKKSLAGKFDEFVEVPCPNYTFGFSWAAGVFLLNFLENYLKGEEVPWKDLGLVAMEEKYHKLQARASG